MSARSAALSVGTGSVVVVVVVDVVLVVDVAVVVGASVDVVELSEVESSPPSSPQATDRRASVRRQTARRRMRWNIRPRLGVGQERANRSRFLRNGVIDSAAVESRRDRSFEE